MKTRRALQILLCALAASVTAQAQDGRKDSILFNPHWNLQVQGGAAYTLGEVQFKEMVSPAVALYAGYQFTPVWGLRAGLSGYESKGAWVSPMEVYKYNYLQGNVDVLVDLGNACCGFNPDRLFNPYAFLGVGVNGAFGNDEAVAVNDAGHRLGYLWRDSKVGPVGRGGLGLGIRLGGRVYFNLEVNANVLSDKYNSKKAGNPDWVFNALGGFTIKLGRTHKVVEVEEPEPVAPPVVPERKAEPVVEKKPEPVVEKPKPVEKLEESVFFKINSAVISSSEEAKVSSLVAYLKAHPKARVSVCGYADKATGTAQYNKVLSQKRAKAVAAALAAKGIDASRVDVDFKGDTVQPFDGVEKNRVTICVAE